MERRIRRIAEETTDYIWPDHFPGKTFEEALEGMATETPDADVFEVPNTVTNGLNLAPHSR